MQHSSQIPPLDAYVRAPWQTQLAAAVHTPGLVPELLRQRAELHPRFAAYYTKLRALPRRVRRALQRQWRLPLASIALLLALGHSPGWAATIPVGGACTLIDALTAANTDTATGGCPAGSGADTLVLPAGSTQTLTEVNNATYGPTGLPVISSVVTIAGQESTIVRDSAAPEFRIMAVGSTGELTLQEATVSGGLAPAPEQGYPYPPRPRGGGVANYGGVLTVMNSTIAGNSTAYDNYTSGGGAGVVNVGGTLTVTHSTIAGNSCGYGYDGGGIGGGVANYGGTLTVTHSTISGNASSSGGGILNDGGTLTVINSTISGNASGNSFSGGSGGVKNSGGTLTVINSTISDNAGGYGGGVENSGGTLTVTHSTIAGNVDGGVWNYGTLTVTNSTISGNVGFSGSGGVWNYGTLTVTNSTISGNVSHSNSGGVENSGGTLTVTNSTISGNVGGGVANGGTLTVTNSTISGNVSYGSGGGVTNFSSGTLTLARTLVSGNTAPTGPEIFNDVAYGAVTADNHNLFGVNGTAGVVGFSPGPTDIMPPAGVLLPDILDPTLAFHGGPTQTHALVPGSPAIDAGGPMCPDATGAPLLADQRGQPRLVDGNGDGTAACDIGAFEFFPLVNAFMTLDPALDTTFDPTPGPEAPAGTFTIIATFTNTSDTPLRFPFFTVTALSSDNLLLNADEGTQGVGATRTPDVDDRVLAPGETVTVDFIIGLHTPERFTFFVDLFGEPVR